MKSNICTFFHDSYTRKGFFAYYFHFLKRNFEFDYNYARLKGPNDCWISRRDLLKIDEGQILLKLESLNLRGVCLDIGAFIGHITILFAKKGSRVIAVEPDKRNIVYLKHNLKINKINNVEIFPYVIDVNDGWSRLVVAPNSAGNSLYQNGFTLNKKALSLLSLLNKINESKIDIIKMDIQGAEYRILKSAPNQVFKQVDKWMVECHSSNKSENQELEKFFRKNNYQVEWLGEQGINSETPHLFATKIPTN